LFTAFSSAFVDQLLGISEKPDVVPDANADTGNNESTIANDSKIANAFFFTVILLI
jgi:hypothetical protein